jgi:hypothetical protein
MGNLFVYCLACPKQNVNWIEGYQHLPHELGLVEIFSWQKRLIHCRSHLDLLQLTFDGNYQASRFVKNSDNLDISTYVSKAYFETKDKVDHDLNEVISFKGAISSVCWCHHFT